MSERENLENGLRKTARITKKILKNPITRRVVIVVVAIASVIILCGSAYDSLTDAFSDEVSEHVRNNPVQYNSDNPDNPSDKSILITDETIDGLIKVIEDMKIDMKSLGISREDIKKFYVAEAVSSEINRVNETNGENEEGGKYYGRVFLKRENPDTGELERLLFEPDLAKLETMSYPDVLNYFSMEGDKICIASIQPSIDKDGKPISKVVMERLSYKDLISQYTVPIEFLLDLCLITQNPNFVSALADKIINETEIVIEVLQETTTTNTTRTYKYKIETETSTKIEDYNKVGDLIGDPVINTSDPILSEFQEETVSTSETRVNSTIQVQSVKNWIMEATRSYNKVTNGPTESDPIGPEEIEDEEKGTHEYTPLTKKINKGGGYTLTYTSTITRKVEQTTLTTIATTSEIYQEGTSSGVKDKVDEFIEMLKTPYLKIGSFQKEAPIHNLKNGDEMFFQMLQNGSRTQSLEKLMRYILEKAIGKNYGVSEFDFSIYDIKDFTDIRGTEIGSNLLREYIHYWEAGEKAKTNADGTKYIIIDDGAGNPVVGYGVDIENCGYKYKFIEAGHPTTIGGEVPVEFVDSIEEAIMNNTMNNVKAYTSGLELTEYQMNALISRAYNCGAAGALNTKRGSPSLEFLDSYNEYWKQETDDQFKLKDQNANFGHKLYTNYMCKPVTAGGEYMAGLETRRRSEWTLFQTGYYDVLDKWHPYILKGGITTDEEARQLQEYLENELIHTKVHRNKEYQNGPFAKWWETPYSQLEKFQCTWWANGRASMYLEQTGTKYKKYPTQVGHGKDYYNNNIAGGWFNYGSTPKPNSIISWTGGQYGHVAYVEGVGEDGIYISHAGNGEAWYGITKIPLNGAFGSMRLNGYIYLDEPK